MSRSNHEGNWLDRGGSPDPVLVRVLAFYLGMDPATVGPSLDEHATNIFGMVAADASEVQIASYLKRVEAESPFPAPDRGRRATAVSLWHIAKAALLRDELQSLKGRWQAEQPAPTQSLSEWLTERIIQGPHGNSRHDTDDATPG